jgi:hypothetical protein
MHDARNVTHHTHSVKSWLAVKQDRVAVHHVTMNNVAILQNN